MKTGEDVKLEKTFLGSEDTKPNRTPADLIHHTTLLTAAPSCVTCPPGLGRTCDIHAFKKELSAHLSSSAGTRGHTQTEHCFKSGQGSAVAFLPTGARPARERVRSASKAAPHLKRSYALGLLSLTLSLPGDVCFAGLGRYTVAYTRKLHVHLKRLINTAKFIINW